MSLNDGPLGIFDSGVGGLTVVGEILRQYPGERIIYLADQAHVPYGGRPLDEIKQLATGISDFLADQGCRAVIMACNISSAVALPSVRRSHAPLPVFGMIESAAKRAADCGEYPIGILATAGTVKSQAYTNHIQQIAPGVEVVEIACPAFVPLVEAGETETDVAVAAAREYLEPLARARCRTIILGCTHYPYLQRSLDKAASDMWDSSPVFIDPAVELVDAIGPVIGSRAQSDSDLTLLTSGDPDEFRRQSRTFLPLVIGRVSKTCWKQSHLCWDRVVKQNEQRLPTKV